MRKLEAGCLPACSPRCCRRRRACANIKRERLVHLTRQRRLKAGRVQACSAAPRAVQTKYASPVPARSGSRPLLNSAQYPCVCYIWLISAHRTACDSSSSPGPASSGSRPRVGGASATAASSCLLPYMEHAVVADQADHGGERKDCAGPPANVRCRHRGPPYKETCTCVELPRWPPCKNTQWCGYLRCWAGCRGRC